jgi:GntR family transcriptional regulator
MAQVTMPRLSARDSRPLYAQIMEVLEREISSGRYKPGDQLPTQEALAEHFGVSLAPIKQALRELEERGIISTRQGRGTYVLDTTPLSEEIIDANRIPHFTRDIRERGGVPSSKVLVLQRVSAEDAPEAAAELRIAAGERMVCVERVRLADGEPLALQTGYFPDRLVPGLVERGLTDEESLTEVLRAEYNLTVALSRQTISATAATRQDARHLRVRTGAPLLLVERTSFLSNREPVEFVIDRRLPKFSFVVWLRRQ